MKTRLAARIVRLWPAIALLAGGQLLMSLLATAPALVGLAMLSHRPALAAVADGDWLNTLAYAMAQLGAGTDGSGLPFDPELEAAAAATGFLALTAPIAALGHALLYTFASGAALALLEEPRLGLWRAGQAHFWAMLRLSLMLYPTTAVVVVVAAILLALLRSSPPASILLLAATLVLLGGFFELTRARIVKRGSRQALRGLWESAALVWRKPLPIAGAWLALGLGNLLILGAVATFTLGSSANNALLAWTVALATILVGAGYKVIRLVVQSYLWRSLG